MGLNFKFFEYLSYEFLVCCPCAYSPPKQQRGQINLHIGCKADVMMRRVYCSCAHIFLILFSISGFKTPYLIYITDKKISATHLSSIGMFFKLPDTFFFCLSWNRSINIEYDEIIQTWSERVKFLVLETRDLIWFFRFWNT